jgi:hypothetical protein
MRLKMRKLLPPSKKMKCKLAPKTKQRVKVKKIQMGYALITLLQRKLVRREGVRRMGIRKMTVKRVGTKRKISKRMGMFTMKHSKKMGMVKMHGIKKLGISRRSVNKVPHM